MLGTLAAIRGQLGDLRKRVNEHNAGLLQAERLQTERPQRERVVVYAGQCVLPDELDDKETE